MAIVPTDAQARRVLGYDFLDDPGPRGLRDALGLDHDSVSSMRFHCATSSPRLYNGGRRGGSSGEQGFAP